MIPPRMRTTLLLLFSVWFPTSAFAGLFGPANQSECLIERLSGADNDTVAGEIVNKCAREFGIGAPIERKDGFFASFHSGSDCTLAKARNTRSQFAARVIQANCYAVYEPARFDPDSAVLVEPRK